jgi:outer membrane receptor protein involved in Fe transport
MEFRGTAMNVFDTSYANPVSDDLRQDTVPQNGRTLRVGLTWRFAAK